MDFLQCYRMAAAFYPAHIKRFYLKRISFTIRLFFLYSRLAGKIESFFAENSLRRYIMLLPDIKEHLYKQQVRSCFYHKSNTKNRWHFLQSHFLFLERTHTEESIKQLYSSSFPPIHFKQGESQLSFKIEYEHSIAREGMLWLLVEMNNVLLYKITFWFSEENGLPTLFIGALQGGQDTLEMNRSFTKEFWGLRPQNMALGILRWYAQTVGIEQIFTFPQNKMWCRKISDNTDLDAFWQEQGAQKVMDTPFIQIDLHTQHKDLSEVATRKRSMYKKRYEFLNRLEYTFTTEIESHLLPHLHLQRKIA